MLVQSLSYLNNFSPIAIADPERHERFDDDGAERGEPDARHPQRRPEENQPTEVEVGREDQSEESHHRSQVTTINEQQSVHFIHSGTSYFYPLHNTVVLLTALCWRHANDLTILSFHHTPTA